ncbi:cytochrome P450 [Punctularia strigosozonata HHB-11173 SS5]|uniref:cytochrome P450 n=1 Tax=Punctularia strigosozonata (strain HHB-11173) TaxID=741275 RepID=UPI0004417A9B|nr:cytochrome P450 [Punctularia strigosozonata HHB-11173 SS5]EIN09519.1 cytochrome P450 [Punctularia strigosozonata HHB-11173 SS5]
MNIIRFQDVLSKVRVLDVSVVAFAIYLAKHFLTRKRLPASYPPGPKGLPGIGNLLQLPKEQEWKTYTEWGAEHGDMAMVDVLGQKMLILNSSRVAADTLDKKSNIYSDRPRMVMAGELVGHDQHITLRSADERFRQFRRLFHGILAGRDNLAGFAPIEERETHRFLLRVLDDPSNLPRHIRKLAGAIIIKICHGYDVVEGEDPMISRIERVMDEFGEVTTPGRYLVDAIPFLAHLPGWLPGMGFKKSAREMRRRLLESVNAPLAFVRGQMAAGKAPRSYTSIYLERLAEGGVPYTEELVKWGSLDLYGGGADTSVAAEYNFYLLMTLYPDIQKKAQAEIDSVVGTDRLPTLADRPNLPYTDALVKEVFRWHPVAPQGLPHVVREDDIHDGYFIPKGTVVIANIWGFLHDPRTYKDPMTFDPLRFIASPGKPAEPDPRSFCFGFGRRVCPGQALGDSSVFLACAMSLAAFDISKSVDDTGRVLEPVVEHTSGIISHPKPFPCTIKPRSAKIEVLIRAVDETRGD